jgi:hypothetical protein
MDYEKEKYRQFFESVPENKREEIGDKIAKLMSGEVNTPSESTKKGGKRMTLDEAIKVYEEGVSKESEQVAEWLKELKRLKEAESEELWIARDRDDDRIYLYEDNPACDEECGMFYECDNDFIIELPKESFPEVTFENSPQKIKIIIK